MEYVLQQSLPLKKRLQKVAFRRNKWIVKSDLSFGIDRCTEKVTEAEEALLRSKARNDLINLRNKLI